MGKEIKSSGIEQNDRVKMVSKVKVTQGKVINPCRVLAEKLKKLGKAEYAEKDKKSLDRQIHRIKTEIREKEDKTVIKTKEITKGNINAG